MTTLFHVYDVVPFLSVLPYGQCWSDYNESEQPFHGQPNRIQPAPSFHLFASPLQQVDVPLSRCLDRVFLLDTVVRDPLCRAEFCALRDSVRDRGEEKYSSSCQGRWIHELPDLSYLEDHVVICAITSIGKIHALQGAN